MTGGTQKENITFQFSLRHDALRGVSGYVMELQTGMRESDTADLTLQIQLQFDPHLLYAARAQCKGNRRHDTVISIYL